MKKIKPGDKIVCIKRGCGADHIPGHHGKPFVARSLTSDFYCLAPPPDQELSVGDWVLPVVMPDEEFMSQWENLQLRRWDYYLLKPFLIAATRYGNYSERDPRVPYWPDSSLAKIERAQNGNYIIGDSCQITAYEFESRYGCRPDIEVSEREDAYSNEKEPANDWPTEQDVRECCGVYAHPMEGMPAYRITPEKLQSNYRDVAHFRLENTAARQIELLPEQYIPGYKEPIIERQTPDWMKSAVDAYPRVTEWD